jgi:hypothetical protein
LGAAGSARESLRPARDTSLIGKAARGTARGPADDFSSTSSRFNTLGAIFCNLRPPAGGGRRPDIEQGLGFLALMFSPDAAAIRIAATSEALLDYGDSEMRFTVTVRVN